MTAPKHWINCEATLMGAVYWMADKEEDHATLETIPPPDALWAVEFLEEELQHWDHDPIAETVQRVATLLWGPGA